MELQLTGSVPLDLNDLEQMALNCWASVLLALRPTDRAVGDAYSPAAASLSSKQYLAKKLCIGCACFHTLIELQAKVTMAQT